MTETTSTETWIEVCRVEDLEPDAGVCALVGGRQVAIFYLPRLEQVFALGNYDPFSHANVLARGLTGDIKGEPVVASPVYKQHFSLRTGRCLEDESVQVSCYRVRFDFRTWAESTAPATAAQEILLFSPRTRRPEVDFHARLVGPEIGPREDPPVGAAMPAFCGYLCSHSHIRRGTYVFTVERGAEDARRSLLNLEMDHRGSDRLSLRIGGKAVVVAEGNVQVP